MLLALQSSPGIRMAQQHRYWSVVENHAGRRRARGAAARAVNLGEINDTQELAWRAVDRGFGRAVLMRNPARCRCFRKTAARDCWQTPRLSASSCRNCGCADRGQWGACWLALLLWRELQLDLFWSKRAGREP